MSFIVDVQTTNDLGIFGKGGSKSVFGLFNKAHTRGGTDILERMLRYPLKQVEDIESRNKTIKFFLDTKQEFPISGASLDSVEQYLINVDERSRLDRVSDGNLPRALQRVFKTDTNAQYIKDSLQSFAELLLDLKRFLDTLNPNITAGYQSDALEISALLNQADFVAFLQSVNDKWGYQQLVHYDKVFRFQRQEQVKKIINHIYQLDAYITIAKVALDKGLVFPKVLDQSENLLKLEGVYHPFVPNAVGNDISMHGEKSVTFLTGANMAGKSTLMKSVGIAIYLAHAGFPVPAKQMEFSVRDGIITTINLPDNLNRGYSHFYAEVLRLKTVAQHLSTSKKLFVLFDELFRGTNVKDAYDATLAVIKAFAARKDSLFIVSTHITEAGDALKQSEQGGIHFEYLPTRLEGGKPVYTYQLQTGITSDRHGMVIINNEGILEQLAKPLKRSEDSNRFLVDKQTMVDLNLLGKYKPSSIFYLFNQVVTEGGARLMDDWFKHPLTQPEQINQRSATFQYFQKRNKPFPVEASLIQAVDNFISHRAANRIDSITHCLQYKILYYIGQQESYRQLTKGIYASIRLIQSLPKVIELLDPNTDNSELKKDIDILNAVFEHPNIRNLQNFRFDAELSFATVCQYDYLLRKRIRENLRLILQILYKIDVYLAVSSVAEKRGFGYAKALPADSNEFHLVDLFHPVLQNPVGNSITMQAESNVLFLTGANMAGKSTLMKATGIATYLAHMGFPVAAKDMEFSVKEGIFTSINVPDDLNKGYSHFYAEVLRVKDVADSVSQKRNLLVIFDELFKGTNVKDAYDGTLGVTQAFSRYRNCNFIISTHIIEVGQALKANNDNLQFSYLPTIMKGRVPKYTYRLKAGITDDRHGMMIIQNEKILEKIKAESTQDHGESI